MNVKISAYAMGMPPRPNSRNPVDHITFRWLTHWRITDYDVYAGEENRGFRTYLRTTIVDGGWRVFDYTADNWPAPPFVEFD